MVKKKFHIQRLLAASVRGVIPEVWQIILQASPIPTP